METETNLTRPSKKSAAAPETVGTTNVVGLHTPFAADAKLPHEGVDEETRLFHGVDPENFERVTVSLEGLQAEFGKELGEKKYLQIAGMAGGSVFFNPGAEATSYRPPLGVSGLKGKHKTELEAILAAKE